MGAVKLNRRTIDRLVVERGNRVFWDSGLPGFGIRVHASGHKVYVAQARIPGGLPKRGVIGRYAEITIEDARRKAVEMIDRIRRGLDPAPPAEPPEPTVADLAEHYMTAHAEVNCRPKTVEQYRCLLDVHILPELGALKLSEVNRSHASALHYRMRDTPYRANQAVGMVSRMFKLATVWGMTPARPDPCRSVKRYRERECERFLSEQEYARLGRVLSEAESEGGPMASAVAAVRLLLLTGCRRNEILRLRWDDVDRTAGELRIRESKTGPRRVPLTAPVERVLARIARIEGNPWVIAGARRGEPLKNINAHWFRLRERAGLEELRLHDCRHSFASEALALGEGLPTIARLLGHKTVMTTYRYAHLAEDSEKASVARVGDSIGNDLLSDEPANDEQAA